MDTLENTLTNEEITDDDFADLSGESTAIEVQKFVVKEPHWKVSRVELLSILDIVSKFPSNASIYFAMYYAKENGTGVVKILASNKDYYLEANLPLINDDHVYDQDVAFFIQMSQLLVLVRAYTDFVFIFNEDHSISFYNTFVTHKLETYGFDLKDYRIGSFEGNFEKFDIKRSLFNVIRRYVSFSARLTDKKIEVVENQIAGFFMLYSFRFDLPFKTKEPFYLRKTDLDVLASLYTYDQLKYGIDTDRIWLRFPLGVVSFSRIEYSKTLFKSLITGEKIGSLQVDLLLLKKAMTVITAFGAQVIALYQKEDDIFIRVKEGTQFKIGNGILNEEFSLSLEVFKKVIASLPDVSPIINISVAETGLTIEIKDGDFVYETEVSRITTSMVERANKIETKKENRAQRVENLKEKGRYQENIDIKDGTLGDFLGTMQA